MTLQMDVQMDGQSEGWSDRRGYNTIPAFSSKSAGIKKTNFQ